MKRTFLILSAIVVASTLFIASTAQSQDDTKATPAPKTAPAPKAEPKVEAAPAPKTKPAPAPKPAPKDEPAKLTVQVVGLSIARANTKSKFGGSLAQGLPMGTVVHFAVTDENLSFTRIEKDLSVIESFTDEKGTNLVVSSGWRKSRLGDHPGISDDKHVVMFRMTSPELPAEGAKEILFRGRVVLEAGSGEKTDTQKGLTLKDGAQITIGPSPFTVNKLRWYSSKGLQFRLVSNKSPSLIKKIEFIGADGKAVTSRRTGRSSSGFGKAKTYGLYYNLSATKTKDKAKDEKAKGDFKDRIKTATVKITYFTKADKIEVPIDVKVGVGM